MPNLDKFNLETIVGKKLADVQLPKEVEAEAERIANKPDQTPDKAAELAFLTRLEIHDILKAESQKNNNAQLPQTFEKLLQENEDFREKVATYKGLLKKAGKEVQKGLKRHRDESNELNGDYLTYNELWGQQLAIEKRLEGIMAKLFSERGHDPDSMLIEKRQLLEEDLLEVRRQIAELKTKNPDTAAYLEYEKIKKYSDELKQGFAWTESRRYIVDEALKRAMASRPLIVLMGESGTGKTALAKALSRKLTGAEPEREVGGKDYRLRDLLGARAIDEQGDYLKFGPLLRAMTGMDSSRDTSSKTSGGVYFDDEFNTRSAEVQRQILKFVAEAKPGQKVTVPGTELKVTVQSKFLYLAAGNPNNDRYDREETPVEAYREFSGVLDVDYLENTKGQPELMEVMVASLMDQKTGRLRAVSKQEVMPSYTNNGMILDELPSIGGFLWRFSQAWKGILQAFAHQQNALHIMNPAQPPQKYHLQKFVLDLGKVRDWLHQYKISTNDQKRGIETYIKEKLREELVSAPSDDQKIVKDMMQIFGINLDQVSPSPAQFTIMSPKEIGYLFPNVPRKNSKTGERSPEPPSVDINDDGEEVMRTPTPQPAPTSRVAGNSEAVRSKDMILHTSGLTQAEKTKLCEMVDSYDDSVEAAKEIDPQARIMPLQHIIEAVLRFGKDTLKEIAKFQKPMLIITPPNPLKSTGTPQSPLNSKEVNMNSNKAYQNQDDAFIWDDPNSPYRQVGIPRKTSVSVVDGAEHMPHIPGIRADLRFDMRKEAFKKHFSDRGMRSINVHEYATLMQRSLRAYRLDGAKDTSKIVDYYQDGNDTVTCLDDAGLATSPHVAYGYFYSRYRQVRFDAGGADDTYAYLRGRPSVQVIEY